MQRPITASSKLYPSADEIKINYEQYKNRITIHNRARGRKMFKYVLILNLQAVHRQREICPSNLLINMHKVVQSQNGHEPVRNKKAISIIDHQLGSVNELHKEFNTRGKAKNNSN